MSSDLPPSTLPERRRENTVPGGVLGPYRLLQVIGEGGIGEVWLADQIHPIRRQVAVKLIKAGMDTREVVVRFESERQVLALMEHPAIAQVYDAGQTPEGRPYFVMEHVPGTPLNQFCDAHRYTVEQRLQLMVQVCEGVQHAHQKAIIHRDLKPNNVLVAVVDGKPWPKIIDFGIAKAVSHQLTDHPMFTEVGTFMGTPEYMSPEQTGLTRHGVDTRTDVYSLGVMLYQLLAGELPFAFDDLRGSSHEEIGRKIREAEPPRPSSRVATSTDPEESAKNRRTQSQNLVKRLRGDLDAVVLRAMEKDPRRRYGTPAELAADLGRYLRSEPVVARTPSTAYRLSKYIRRHRAVATAALALSVVGASFLISTLVQTRQTANERDRANREAVAARRAFDFLTRTFTLADPSESRGNTITVREVLERAAQDVEPELAKEPELHARMLHTFGEVYLGLGLFARAENLLERAVAIRKSLLGAEHRDTLASMHELAQALRSAGKLPRAEAMFRETLDSRRRILGPNDPDTVATLKGLAEVLYDLGRFPVAETTFREVIDTAGRVLGPDHPQTLSAMHGLARALRSEGQLNQAEALLRETAERQKRVLGADHPDTLATQFRLGLTMQDLGRFGEAEVIHRETLDARRRVYGPEHPTTLGSMHNLALTYSGLKRYADSEALNREAFNVRRRVLGPEHPDTLGSMQSLAASLYWLRRYPEAEQLARGALDLQTRVLGTEHRNTLRSMNVLGSILQAEGNYPEATQLLHAALDIQRRVLGPEHPDTAETTYALGVVAALQGRVNEALGLLEEALEHGLSNEGALRFETDEDLRRLRGHPRFEALVARGKTRAQ